MRSSMQELTLAMVMFRPTHNRRVENELNDENRNNKH